MTTMEGAFALFMAMLTVGLTVASLWRGGVTRSNNDRELLHAVSARPTTRADLAWDYCAGHDGVVLRKAMRWTADGEWRCRECAPPTEAELAAELSAAGAAVAVPIFLSAPSTGKRFETLDEAKAELRHRGSGTITRHVTTYGEHYTVGPHPFSNAYADQNAKPVAYGITDDGEWSLWENQRQAQLYAQRTPNARPTGIAR